MSLSNVPKPNIKENLTVTVWAVHMALYSICLLTFDYTAGCCYLLSTKAIMSQW